MKKINTKAMAKQKKPQVVFKKRHIKAKKSLLGYLLAPFAFIAFSFVIYIAKIQSSDFQASVFGNTTSSGLSTPKRLDGISGTRSMLNLMVGWGNFILPYIVVIATLSLIYGAVLFVTAGGNSDNVEKGKKILIWSAIALLLVMSSFAIVNTIVNFDD